MSQARKVAVIIGSLRKGAYSRMTANALISVAPSSLELEIVEIGDLTMYNQDLDETPPKSWTEFRNKIKEFDAVLFITPEYNRSVPAVIKNAIDIGSRPPGASVWSGKPGASVSTSPGAMGGVSAHLNLRQTLVAVNVINMPQPEMYIGGVSKLFNEEGELVVDATREFFTKFMVSFGAWIEKIAN
jgi:chromate reductase